MSVFHVTYFCECVLCSFADRIGCAVGVSQTMVSMVVSAVSHKLGMIGKRPSWLISGTIPVWRGRRKLRKVTVVTVSTNMAIVVKVTAWDTTHTWFSLCIGMRPLQQNTVCVLHVSPQYHSFRVSFVTYEARCLQDFRVHFSSHFSVTYFVTGFELLISVPKQASHLLKIFLDTWRSYCREILIVPHQKLPASSSN
jgi:hypothetical protein